MLLTDEEITLIVRECARGSAINRDGSTSHRIARAVIAACEAKLREQQEPVAEVSAGTFVYWANEKVPKVGTKLFTHPAPIPEGWQPIETAPKDGTRVLIKGDCTVVAGWQEITGMFGLMGWAIVNDAWMSSGEARYWMPLPKPPMAVRSGE